MCTHAEAGSSPPAHRPHSPVRARERASTRTSVTPTHAQTLFRPFSPRWVFSAISLRQRADRPRQRPREDVTRSASGTSRRPPSGERSPSVKDEHRKFSSPWKAWAELFSSKLPLHPPPPLHAGVKIKVKTTSPEEPSSMIRSWGGVHACMGAARSPPPGPHAAPKSEDARFGGGITS